MVEATDKAYALQEEAKGTYNIGNGRWEWKRALGRAGVGAVSTDTSFLSLPGLGLGPGFYWHTRI
jgi:hypothetical protein